MGNKKGVKESAFSGQKTIFSAHFGSDCDYIGSNAFDGCISLSEINDDNNITKIGAKAFRETGIYRATFKKLTNIGESAFQNCVNLESIDMPECTNIEKNAFKETGIIHATFKKLTEIGESAFQDCKKLENIDIPFCSEIGANAFNGCKNISQISLLNCDKISDSGFFNCENLKKVYIYSDSCELEENVFYKGEGDNTSIIDGIVFYFKPNMYSKYLGNDTWEPYKKHMITIADEKNIIYKSNTGSGINTIEGLPINNNNSKYIEGICGILNFNEPITSLGKIFSVPGQLADIDFPPTCVEIKEHAFEGCNNLTNITLPEDLQTIGEYAFSGCSKFTTITIPQYVNKLGEGIFAGCSNLKTFYGKFATYGGKAIVYNNTLICVSPNDDSETGGRIYDISKIDRNITRLGNSCFSGCVELRRVNIPKSVQEIGANIFDGCEKLQEIHFYGKIPEIGSLGIINESVKIFVPETDINEYLNSSSFEQYKNNIYPRPDNGLLYFVTKIPNDVETKTYTVGGETKTYCTISNMGTEIHGKYFQNNSSITSVILSDNISKIGSFAFDGCENLMYIYIPDSIISIGNQCFRNCKNLEKIHMPYGTLSTKASFGSKIFEGCSSLQKFGTYYKDYVSNDDRCYIQNGILKFFAESNLMEYAIPSDMNIHTIGESAFEGTNISSIELNDYIKTIAPNAFYGCKDLSKILNWDNVITISENAFNGCESLGTSVPDPIPLPKYLKKIDNFAFSNCSKLNVSRIPRNVSYIGDYAFAGTSCEEIDLSDTKIHQINQCAFKNCTNLVNIKLSKNTRTIKESAFEGCGNLTTVEQDKLSQIVNYNLETIGDSAFKDCKELSDIPYSGVSYVGDYAFAGCYINSNSNSDKEEIEIKLNNIEHIGVGCFSGSGITKLKINNASKLTQISKNAFYNCSNLTSIEIPDTIKSIGDSAFCNCGKLGYGYTKDENEEEILNKIKLPKQLKELGERCFSFDDEYKDEKKEKTIVIQNGMETIPIFTKNEINESSSSLPFYKIKVRIEIPDNKLINFLSNEYWNSYYKNIYTYPSNQQ